MLNSAHASLLIEPISNTAGVADKLKQIFTDHKVYDFY